MSKPWTIWIGYDARESDGFAVARNTARQLCQIPVPIYGLDIGSLQSQGLYTRPMARDGGQLIDLISKAPMSTEFALTRFLVPHLAESGLALFVDCDVMFRQSPIRLFERADLSKAVSVVQHEYDPEDALKMDGQAQTRYARKNWSSVMLFNCDHPRNDPLSVEYVNSRRGLDMHQFDWLRDSDIGELDTQWNYLVGHHTREDCADPAIVHYTEGLPWMREGCEYADEWFKARSEWVRFS